ncbi:MAG TPA: DUF3108 domain-containing protein, partial [Thermoanaerobaculia bacterium]|nr:DUF3108 domain-containing protein [Thermoanaerobaculia bacterium]
VALLAVCAMALPLSAETLQYNWTMRGGLSWIAGLRFPTSGVGYLTQAANGETLNASLRITSPHDPTAALVYESTMSPAGERTVASTEGYDWQTNTRYLRSMFDSVKQLLHTQKTTPKGTETKVQPWTGGDVRDVLTAIQYLRVHGNELASAVPTTVYSNGRAYPVLITPGGTTTVNNVATKQFRIQAAPGASAKYPGEVRLWISADQRRVPIRIELAQKLGTVRLDLI